MEKAWIRLTELFKELIENGTYEIISNLFKCLQTSLIPCVFS